jgi:hypothetical protein
MSKQMTKAEFIEQILPLVLVVLTVVALAVWYVVTAFARG